MKRRALSLAAVAWLLLALLVACVPAAAPTPAAAPPTAKPAAPAVTVAPAPTPTSVKPAAPATPTPVKPAATPTAAAGPKYGGWFNNSVWANIEHFDLHQTTQGSVLYCTYKAYNNLLQYAPFDEAEKEIIGDLAESWQYDASGTVLTFRLRKGVKFHDGTPFTAADAKYSLERIWQPPKGVLSDRQGLFAAVDKIEAPDEHTLVVTTKFPVGSLLAAFATPWNVIFPKQVLEAKRDMKDTMLGTGPFKFVSWTPNSVLKLAKNPNYYRKDRPYLDGINSYIIPDHATRLAALFAGKLDWSGDSGVGLATRDQAEIVKRDRPDLIVVSKPRLYLRTVWLNAEKTTPPLNDRRVREAINETINREEILAGIGEEGVVGAHLFPAGPWGLPQEKLVKLPGFGPDMKARLARAKSLLAEAGYPNGFELKGLFWTEYVPSYGTGQVLKEQLARIGINMSIEVIPNRIGNPRRAQGGYEIHAIHHGQAMDDPDGTFAIHLTTGSGRNYARRTNPKIDELFEKQTRLLDYKERKKIVDEMVEEAVRDSAMIPLYWGNDYHARHPYVKGAWVAANPYSTVVRMEEIWLDK